MKKRTYSELTIKTAKFTTGMFVYRAVVSDNIAFFCQGTDKRISPVFTRLSEAFAWLHGYVACMKTHKRS